MFASFQYLLNRPYNSRWRIPAAMYRYFMWKIIRALKLEVSSYRVWGNRRVNVRYNSIQCMWLMYHYWVDWEEYNLIADVLKPNDTVFDVGANIGLYSLWISKFNTQGKVHSFEPDNQNYSRLLHHVKMNSLENSIVANRLAVADFAGCMFLTQGSDIKNHLAKEEAKDTVQVNVTTVDNYCRSHSIDQIRYLKIDIEGFELSALKGAAAMLAEGKVDIIQLEINNALTFSGVSHYDVVDFLSLYNYVLAYYNVEEKKLKKVVYTVERENYFAVRSIEKLNLQLSHKRKEDQIK